MMLICVNLNFLSSVLLWPRRIYEVNVCKVQHSIFFFSHRCCRRLGCISEMLEEAIGHEERNIQASFLQKPWWYGGWITEPWGTSFFSPLSVFISQRKAKKKIIKVCCSYKCFKNSGSYFCPFVQVDAMLSVNVYSHKEIVAHGPWFECSVRGL